MKYFLQCIITGKTCEDVRRHKDIRLATTPTQADKLLSKASYSHHVIYEENFAAIELQKTTVILDKPRYIGACVLDLSKLIMYRFHYEYLMPRYPEAKLLFTDTDSFCYWIPSKTDLYQDMKQHGAGWFDFSNYPIDSDLFDNDVNHLIPGRFKDEMAGEIITEFVGLRAKMYSILTLNGFNKKTAKGVISEVKNMQIRHNDFKTCLFEEKVFTHTGAKIASNRHQLSTVNITKKTLSPYNDKRWIEKQSDKTYRCHSFGHLDTL